MPQQTQTRKEIEAVLIAKAQAEPAFRHALVKNCKAAIEKEFGVALPAGFEWSVIEETATSNYLVLPIDTDGELPDADLQSVAGGNASQQEARDRRKSGLDNLQKLLDIIRGMNPKI